ncbi:MAG: VWA domain-containing protein, partial [Myxococcales bacterium]|nr:VWA domain-containing protein [Myxococcales bacterium]
MTDYFDHSERFFLLIAPAVAVLLYLLYRRWKNRRIKAIGDPELVGAMTASHSGRREVASFSLAAMALLLGAVALAGPQWGESEQTVERRGIDVVFAVDISRSMWAEDIPPSRLAAAKNEIRRILTLLRGDRVGLVGFAGIAYPQSPLTSDYGAIGRFLDGMNPRLLPRAQGTSIARAIREATELLLGDRSVKVEGEDGEPLEGRDMERGHDQIVVVFTDGEDHAGAAAQEAERARERGIFVFTVAIGTEEGGVVPLYNDQGERTGLLTYQGEQVISRMDPDALREVAEIGGGEHIVYTGEGSVANVLSAWIDDFEDAELESILSPQRENRFYFFLIPAVVLLLMSLLIGDRKRRIDDPFLAMMLLGVLSVSLIGCEDAFIYESDQVREGVEMSAGENPEAGLQMIQDFRDEMANVDLIDPPSAAYNEGVAQLRVGDFVHAREEFLEALASDSDEVVFRAYYNLGNLSFLQEEWRDAYHRYTQALEVNPDDEDARWNLEVALRRIYPPCHELEDSHEENDDPTQAQLWQPPQESPEASDGASDEDAPPEYVLCGGDPDWYRLEGLEPGSRLSIVTNLTRLREDTGGTPPPETLPPEAVWMQLYDETGEHLIAEDNGQMLTAAG